MHVQSTIFKEDCDFGAILDEGTNGPLKACISPCKKIPAKSTDDTTGFIFLKVNCVTDVIRYDIEG